MSFHAEKAKIAKYFQYFWRDGPCNSRYKFKYRNIRPNPYLVAVSTSQKCASAAGSKHALPFLAALSIAGTQATAATGYSQITDVEAFNQLVVGKTLSRNNSSFTIEDDGTISGTYAGRTMEGTWEWVGDAFCRTLTTPQRGFSCQMVKSNGENARFMRYPNNGLPVVEEAISRNQ